jgi:hypothetical protein
MRWQTVIAVARCDMIGMNSLVNGSGDDDAPGLSSSTAP